MVEPTEISLTGEKQVKKPKLLVEVEKETLTSPSLNGSQNESLKDSTSSVRHGKEPESETDDEDDSYDDEEDDDEDQDELESLGVGHYVPSTTSEEVFDVDGPVARLLRLARSSVMKIEAAQKAASGSLTSSTNITPSTSATSTVVSSSSTAVIPTTSSTKTEPTVTASEKSVAGPIENGDVTTGGTSGKRKKGERKERNRSSLLTKEKKEKKGAEEIRSGEKKKEKKRSKKRVDHRKSSKSKTKSKKNEQEEKEEKNPTPQSEEKTQAKQTTKEIKEEVTESNTENDKGQVKEQKEILEENEVKQEDIKKEADEMKGKETKAELEETPKVVESNDDSQHHDVTMLITLEIKEIEHEREPSSTTNTDNQPTEAPITTSDAYDVDSRKTEGEKEKEISLAPAEISTTTTLSEVLAVDEVKREEELPKATSEVKSDEDKGPTSGEETRSAPLKQHEVIISSDSSPSPPAPVASSETEEEEETEDGSGSGIALRRETESQMVSMVTPARPASMVIAAPSTRDEYGFIVKTEEEEAWKKERNSEGKAALRQRRQVFWNKHLSKRSKPAKRSALKSPIRGGIPAEHRAMMWQVLTGSRQLLESHPGHYQSLLDSKSGEITAATTQIGLDLRRTFPDNELFQTEEGIERLRRVLVAYSWHNTEVGYCQAMNFVCGLLLLFMTEEEAFWMMVVIVEKLMAGYYTNTMEASHVDQRVFRAMVAKKLPELSSFLNKTMGSVELSWFTRQWFLCLFIDVLPIETTLRVWDVFFNEGTKVLFRLGLALLKINQKRIIEAGSKGDEMMVFKAIKESGFGCHDADALLKVAFHRIGSMSHATIDKLRVVHKATVTSDRQRSDTARMSHSSPSSPFPSSTKSVVRSASSLVTPSVFSKKKNVQRSASSLTPTPASGSIFPPVTSAAAPTPKETPAASEPSTAVSNGAVSSDPTPVPTTPQVEVEPKQPNNAEEEGKAESMKTITEPVASTAPVVSKTISRSTSGVDVETSATTTPTTTDTESESDFGGEEKTTTTTRTRTETETKETKTANEETKTVVHTPTTTETDAPTEATATTTIEGEEQN